MHVKSVQGAEDGAGSDYTESAFTLDGETAGAPEAPPAPSRPGCNAIVPAPSASAAAAKVLKENSKPFFKDHVDDSDSEADDEQDVAMLHGWSVPVTRASSSKQRKLKKG